MNRRANILARLRRWKSGAGRYVVSSFALAYLSVGVAPCVAAVSQGTVELAIAHEVDESSHEGHAVHEHGDAVAPSHAGHVTHAGMPPVDDSGREHCPHCGVARAHDDHHSCFALEDLTNVAASQAKSPPPPLGPSLGPAVFTWPPSLASPAPPPLRAVPIPPVPLNVRHCVFLI